MSGVGGRRLTVLAAMVGALITGVGAAYALAPSSLRSNQVAEQEAPDGTQPMNDDDEATASASRSSAMISADRTLESSAPAQTPSMPTLPSAAGTAAGVPTTGGCPTGEKQREVEQYLAQIGTYGPVTVDGQQSAADCAAIKKLQIRFGINQPNGRAGVTTAEVARRIATSLTPAEQAKCNAGPELTACVDLTLQTVWVVRNGSVVFGPTVIRTGMSGYATPAGTYSIGERSVKSWSKPYKVWLPYWQNIVRGIGFHATTTYLHTSSIGSHGCVNLLYPDAKTLYETIGTGTRVTVFGRRSGT